MGFPRIRAVVAGLSSAAPIGRLIVLWARSPARGRRRRKALRSVPGAPRGTRMTYVVAEASAPASSRFHPEMLGVAANLGEVGGGERRLRIAGRTLPGAARSTDSRARSRRWRRPRSEERRPRLLLPAPALEARGIEHDVAHGGVCEWLQTTKTGVPAGWPGRSMKGRRAITFGRCRRRGRATRRRPDALVEAEDAEVGPGRGDGGDHRRGALVRAVGHAEAEVEAGRVAHRRVAARDVGMDRERGLDVGEGRDDDAPDALRRVERQAAGVARRERRIIAASRPGRKAEPVSEVFLTAISRSMMSPRSSGAGASPRRCGRSRPADRRAPADCRPLPVSVSAPSGHAFPTPAAVFSQSNRLLAPAIAIPKRRTAKLVRLFLAG